MTTEEDVVEPRDEIPFRSAGGAIPDIFLSRLISFFPAAFSMRLLTHTSVRVCMCVFVHVCNM